MNAITEFRGKHAFLSNFSSADVVLDGVTYPTVEHAFQAAKTLDPVAREVIRRASTPGNAKYHGQRVTLRDGWDRMRLDVMIDLVRQKFTPLHRRAELLDTGDADLVEGNTWHDNFWGDCRCGRDSCERPGENWLGAVLMLVRSEARNG